MRGTAEQFGRCACAAGSTLISRLEQRFDSIDFFDEFENVALAIMARPIDLIGWRADLDLCRSSESSRVYGA